MMWNMLKVLLWSPCILFIGLFYLVMWLVDGKLRDDDDYWP